MPGQRASGPEADGPAASTRRPFTLRAGQPGDPARVARIITEIARLDEPPLRLLLGSDALRIAGESAQARTAEAAEWAAVSRSADFS